MADQYLARMAERLDPRQADLALDVPPLTQSHELIRDIAKYGQFFSQGATHTEEAP